MMEKRTRGGLRSVTPLDIILAVLLIAGSFLALLLPPALQRDAPVTAVITCGGEVWREINLDEVREPYELDLPTQPEVTVTVEPGSIRFSRAGCPDQLCVNAGVLDAPGDTAACLPVGAVISLRAEGREADDILTY